MLFGLKLSLKFTATLEASVKSPKEQLSLEKSLCQRIKTVLTKTLARNLQSRPSDFSVL